MSELNFTKLADAPVLDEVPDGAKVYAEVDGKVYRVAGDNLGGGIPTAIFKLNMDSGDTASVQSLLSGGVAAVDAGDNARAVETPPVYTATCENMTYEECKAIFLAGGSVNARLQVFQGDESQVTTVSDEVSVSGGYVGLNSVEAIGFTFLSYINQYDGLTFYWLPDGTITTDTSKLGG